MSGIKQVMLYQSPVLEEEDAISIFIYLLHMPAERLRTAEDVETAAKLMFDMELRIFKDNFFNQFSDIIHNLKSNGYVIMKFKTNEQFRVYVHDKFMSKIVLLSSLKYMKLEFEHSDESTRFLQFVLEEIADTVCLHKQQTMQLLKVLEVILKKREDILNPPLAVFLLTTMSRVAYSPLPGFKHSAQNVNKIVLKSLPHDFKNYVYNFNNLPIRGVSLQDVLSQFSRKDVRSMLNLINKKILNQFQRNTDSRDGSFFYEMILNFCTFEEFKTDIWPYYSPYLQQFEEGEFHQSFLKYWIPVTVKFYGYHLFHLCNDIDDIFKCHFFLEFKKRGIYNQEIQRVLKHLLFNQKTSHLALRVVCTFQSKKDRPNEDSLLIVMQYLLLNNEVEFSDHILKSLRMFFSQIFLFTHLCQMRKLSSLSNVLYVFVRFVFHKISHSTHGVPMQVFKLMWDIASGSSSDLETAYKLDRECEYEKEENYYYQYLRACGFWSDSFLYWKLITKIMNAVTKLSFSSEFTELVKEQYLDFVDIDPDFDLILVLALFSQKVCSKTSEYLRNYTDLFISCKRLYNESYTIKIETLNNLFMKTLHGCALNKVFTLVLILDMLIVIEKYQDIDVASIIVRTFIFIECYWNSNLLFGLDPKELKVLEALINNFIELLVLYNKDWSRLDTDQVFYYLCEIINNSNMKRPVTVAADAIYKLGLYMENSDNREPKFKLLDKTLQLLYENKQSGKIRRNPETRLVIHALCRSDKNQTKPFLMTSLNFMLEILSNPSSTDLTLASTLHSLEVLVSDNSIHQHTLPFMLPIIQNCILLFDKTNWIVRNADLQLLKSLIERCLGVSLDENIRPKTIEDIFILFPELRSEFYGVLSRHKLTDSAIVPLSFFAESQIIHNSLVGPSLETDFEKYQNLFIAIIREYPNSFGFMAIKAFTSLCPMSKIPNVILEIIDYIQLNFKQIGQMNKNIFAITVKHLKELYQKYQLAMVKTRERDIINALNNLCNYLKQFDSFYFSLLSLKVQTVDEITEEVVTSLSGEIDFIRSIWLNNYLPFVFSGIEADRLHLLLDRVLSKDVPDQLHIRILSIIVDRMNEICVEQVIKILILNLVKLNDKFLIESYSKTILVCSDKVPDINCDELVVSIRLDFDTNYIYKMIIYIFILSYCNNKSSKDCEFVTRCVRKYFDRRGDEEVLSDLASSLIYLYKCGSLGDRYNVIKLAFCFLLNASTSSEICKFTSVLTKYYSSSVLYNFTTLCKVSNLSKLVGGERLALRLLREIDCYVDRLPDQEVSDTYYLIENSLSLSKPTVKKVIRHSLCYFT